MSGRVADCDPLMPLTLKLKGLVVEAERLLSVNLLDCPSKSEAGLNVQVAPAEQPSVMVPVKLEGPEAATVKAAAEDSKRTPREDNESAPIDVTIRKVEAPSVQAIANEAKKGYDLLLMGLEHTRAKNGGFHPDAARIASAFDGPLAVVAGRGAHLQQPERSPLHILVPVHGTEVSRRAAEVAIAIARACGCPLTALYVSNPGARAARKGRSFRARAQEEAIVKDIVELADRYDVQTKTFVRSEVAPDQAILTESKKAGHDLIIMGVSRRPGDKLFFGDTAAAVFEQSAISIIFVAS